MRRLGGCNAAAACGCHLLRLPLPRSLAASGSPALLLPVHLPRARCALRWSHSGLCKHRPVHGSPGSSCLRAASQPHTCSRLRSLQPAAASGARARRGHVPGEAGSAHVSRSPLGLDSAASTSPRAGLAQPQAVAAPPRPAPGPASETCRPRSPSSLHTWLTHERPVTPLTFDGVAPRSRRDAQTSELDTPSPHEGAWCAGGRALQQLQGLHQFLQVPQASFSPYRGSIAATSARLRPPHLRLRHTWHP